MEEFEKLKDSVGEVELIGENLGNAGKKTLIDLCCDEWIDGIYHLIVDSMNRSKELANKYKDKDLEFSKEKQEEADRLSKLIEDEKKYKDNARKSLTFLKNFYLITNEKSMNEEILPYPVEEGKALIPPESVFHWTAVSQLPGISKGGLLASEWFGIIESEFEGIFCSFVSKKDEYNNFDGPLKPGGSRLLFDTDSPIAKLLFSMDYFAYEKMKAQSPDLIEKTFLPEVIELFETVIEPLCPKGKTMYLDPKSAAWMAIPGGIPAPLVKGIMLSSKEENLDELAKNCSELFPRAMIFDDTKTVLAMPKLLNEEDKRKGASI